MATITITMLCTLYMVLWPAPWLERLMELTYLSWDFKIFIIVLGLVYFALAWIGEHYVFQRFARMIGQVKEKVTKRQKTRKEYKIIQEGMLF